MKLFKPKSGFTLIELLVVIGILAVLAAIAIPSVAGLIDRANVSADQTNANEMTNAMERFISEYELYRQDIASGLIKDENDDGVPDNLDAAQGRVYNVTGAKTLEDIHKLESSAGFNGILLDIDTKYAKNLKTAQAIIKNYTKTSSSTFEPKQSDMTYWYSVDTGFTVVASPDATTDELNELLHNANAHDQIESLMNWIDLSQKTDVPEMQIADAWFWNNSGYYIIQIQFEVTNPRYKDVDFSKLYLIKSNNPNVELNMETATETLNLQSRFDVGNLEYISRQTGSTMKLTNWTPLNSFCDDDKDLQIQMRMAYEYEENGKIEYIYTPIVKVSYNELLAQGKDFTETHWFKDPPQ